MQNKIALYPLSDNKHPKDASFEFRLSNGMKGWLLCQGKLVVDRMEYDYSEPNFVHVYAGAVQHLYSEVDDNGKKYCKIYCCDARQQFDVSDKVCPHHKLAIS